MSQLSMFNTAAKSKQKVVNVASVPQRSPFRYPGGKTWFVPILRKWLKNGKAPLLIEPFAGGAIISLTSAFENLAERILMVELDNEIAAVWKTILSDDNDWLCDRIMSFDLTIDNANAELQKEGKTTRDIAFCTIIKNRTYHGGILAKGSGFLKHGEAGKGILSRWYPETLRDRIQNIKLVKDKIEFFEGDAFDTIRKHNSSENYFFIDPPYTIAGKRLYTHYNIDHKELFKLISEIEGRYLVTYDNSEEVQDWASTYKLKSKLVPMKTTHHLEKYEIVISDNFKWFK